MQDIVGHHDRRDDAEEDNQRVEHGDGPDAVEIVVAEEREVNSQADEKDGDKENLSHNSDANLLVAFVSTFQLLLVGEENVVGLAVDNIASVDDLLSALGGQRDAVGKIAQTGLATLLVVTQVGRDVVVEVTFLQNLAMAVKLRIEEELLVCRDSGVDVVDFQADGSLAANDAHQLCCVFIDESIVGSAHDAVLIDSV